MNPRMEPPRYQAQPQAEAPPPGRVVAYVDDIEPERSSPERTIRTGEPRTADSRQDPPSRTNRPSIFNLWRGRKGEEETKRHEPEAPAARQRPEAAAPTPLRAPQPQPQAEAPPRQAAAGPNIETQQPRRAKEDDVLEIPAFLRRQAN
jgi:cell division protein FtsZ